MINEDRLADIEQAYHESSTKLHKQIVTVSYSGAYEYEYEDCTLEEAMAMAKEEFHQECKNTYLDLEVDEVREGSI
jgi:hypothetical protein